MKEKFPQRKNIRLQYDYSKEGMYFITICTKNREELFGKIQDEKQIELTNIGKIVENCIIDFNRIYQNITIDEYIIMPNHVHMIISIIGENNITIPRIINQYKGNITKRIGYSIWQKLFYDHIIRNEKEYWKIKEYIQNNIANWNKDIYF